MPSKFTRLWEIDFASFNESGDLTRLQDNSRQYYFDNYQLKLDLFTYKGNRGRILG